MTAVTYAQGIDGPVLADLTSTPLGWMDWAACTEVDPSIFFPTKGGTVRPAKRVCWECPVRAECRDDQLAWESATRQDHIHGVFGGLSAPEREDVLTGARSLAEVEDALAAQMAGRPPEKRCTGPCGLVQPLTGFGRDPAGAHGWRGDCKACRNASDRRRRAAKRAEVAA